MAQTVLLAAATILLLSHALCKADGDQYQLKYDVSKETWSKVNGAADHSTDTTTLLGNYKGPRAEECKTQLAGRQWNTDLDKKLVQIRGKVEYIDKLMRQDAQRCPAKDKTCVVSIIDKGTRDLDALATKSTREVSSLKAAINKNQKTFMDECTQEQTPSVVST